jgi:hypothetical protein
MNDRELLEAAAKAAGIEIKYNYLGTRAPSAQWDARCPWNPLDDDGDALRLAVKLHLRVMPQEKCTYVETNPDSLLSFPNVSELEMHGSNPYAATRRAIVRAAAEIGRGQK